MLFLVGAWAYNSSTMGNKNDTGHYEGALLEDINHKFDVIVEYLAPLSSLPRDVAGLKSNMRDIEARLGNVEFAVIDMSKELRQLDRRVEWLDGRIGRFKKASA